MATFITSTRKKAAYSSVADEKDKEIIRKEYKRQDADTPYRLFVCTPGKPTVHTAATKGAAKEVFDMYDGFTRLMMDMRTGKILMYTK